MNTEEIRQIMLKKLSKNKSTVGASNSVQKLDKWTYIILNTDCNCHSGSHWVALHKIGKKNYEFFDSFGKSITDYPCLKHLNSEYKFATVNIRLQNWLTNVCGQYALFFLMARKNKYTVNEIYKIFKGKPTIKNDVVIYKTFKRKFKLAPPLLTS